MADSVERSESQKELTPTSKPEEGPGPSSDYKLSSTPGVPLRSDTTDDESSISPARSFARSIRHWPIFPHGHRLAKHFKLVVLSNVDRESFRWTHRELSERWSTPPMEIIWGHMRTPTRIQMGFGILKHRD